MVKSATTGKVRAAWTLDRQAIIWINCNPQVGREMRDLHPFLVLSPKTFIERTSLVVGLPMTTAAYNADNPFAVAVGPAEGRKHDATVISLNRSAGVCAAASRIRPSASMMRT